MNRRQRKFLEELSDLMQKHKVRVDICTDYGQFTRLRFNVSGDELNIYNSFSPKILRELVNK